MGHHTNRNGYSRPALSEKGLLTPDNCVLALVDFQPQMLFGVSNFDRQDIINKTVAVAKASRIFDVPTVLSTVESATFSGYIWPQLSAVFPNQPPVERTTMNAWDDKHFVAAIENTGRRKIVLAGLWTEACVTYPTIQALHDGYEVYIIADACGDISDLAHEMAMQRCIQAGAKPLSALQTILEWQRDWANTETYAAVMDIARNHFGAYGVGVEYSNTMVHSAKATVYPAYVVPELAPAAQ
jgi:nicotinamidase-related amidase